MDQTSHLIDPGLWAETRTHRRGGPALFLDRDGVIVAEVNYLRRIEDVQLTEGAASLIAAANQRGIAVVMVTNQAGVGRGIYGWADFSAVQDEIYSFLALEGARIDAVFACGYHEKGQPPLDAPDHPWRKPNPGMIRTAAEALSLDLARSWIVGDRASDLAAGSSAGLAGGALVETGYGSEREEREAAQALGRGPFAVRKIPRLANFDLSLIG